VRERPGTRECAIKGPRILLVDDHEQVLAVMEEALRDAGYEPRVVRDSRQVSSALGEEPFDILITDVVMPHLHGLDVLRIAKQHNPNIRVLLVTAYANQSLLREALSDGACGLLEKPFQVDAFVAAVEGAARASPELGSATTPEADGGGRTGSAEQRS
jgi:DNA-binding NtrC family response regulator